MEFNWFKVTGQRREEWENLCPLNSYAMLSPDQLPAIIPAALAKKCDSVLMMASGLSMGSAFYVANLNRVDFKASAIDQQPFGILFYGANPLGSACLVQHGNWRGRTTIPSTEFWQHVAESGIGYRLSIPELSSNLSGELSELEQSSHRTAFDIVVERLRQVAEE